jgi:hypothetical protein
LEAVQPQVHSVKWKRDDDELQGKLISFLFSSGREVKGKKRVIEGVNNDLSKDVKRSGNAMYIYINLNVDVLKS